jgi:AsmA protein
MARPSSASGPLRKAAIVLGAVVVLVAIAWGTLTLLFPPARVRALVGQQLSQALTREVRFVGASVGLFPPVRLTVTQPALAEPGGFARGAAFQARSLHLDLDVFALVGGKVVVRRMVVDGPSLHLVMRPDGTTNLDGIARPAKDERVAKPMDLAVRELRVVGGRLLVDDLKAERRTALAIDSRLTLASERAGTRTSTSGSTLLSELAVGPLSATRLSDLNQGLAKLRWRIDHRGVFDSKQQRLALERLDLGVGRAQVAVRGVVDAPGPKARLDLKVAGSEVDLAEILDALSVADARALNGLRGAGRLDFDLAVRGRLGPDRLPTLVGPLSLTGGEFRYPGTTAGVQGLAFHARFGPDSVHIPDVVARVAGQPVRGRLLVTRLQDPVVSFSIQGDVDLAAVAPLLAPKDTRLAGRAAVDVSGRGRAKDPGSMALEGRATLREVSVEAPRLPEKVEQISGEVRFSQSRAQVNQLTARAGKSSFTLDANVTRPLALLAPLEPKSGPKVAPAGVDFTLRSPYLDLAELLPPGPGEVLTPNATGGGRVTIGQLKNQKLDVRQVSATVGFEPGIVAVPSFSLQGYGGAIVGNARFDLRDPAKPGFAVKAKAESLQANAFLSTWTGAKDWLRGSLTTDIDLSGRGTTPDLLQQTLSAAGLADFANGQVGPGPALEAVARATRIDGLEDLRFKDLHLPFRVERGRVITDRATIDGPNGKWITTGGVGFDGSLDYAVSVTLPPDVVQRLGARSAVAAGALTDEQGNMLIDLRVSGTARSPKVALDLASMRDRLIGKASAALTDQKERLEQQARDALAARQKTAEDSLRRVIDQRKKALEDSLKNRARDVLRGFFGGGDSTAP